MILSVRGLLMFFLVISLGGSHDDFVSWKEKVLINNMPVFDDTVTMAENRKHGLYGSEYGRMLKLTNDHWLAAYTISRNKGYQQEAKGGLELQIAESSDNGRIWSVISTITDPGRDLDNAQMIQLKDGSVLLGCRSVRWFESYRLPVYKSTDNGKHWTKLSLIDSHEGTPGSLGNPQKGMYEPHFQLLDNGKLSVMYANEKHVMENPSYSQIISQRVSDDLGKSWGEEIWVAYAPGHHASRPGMPVWSKMSNGQYIVVYEICGPEKCNVYYKTSQEGTTWPVGLGTLIPEQLGGPYILSLADGRLVVSSNSSAISMSEDHGRTWQKVASAWSTSLWSSLYQTGPAEICVMNSVNRPEGGHNVQIRFGIIEPRP